MKHSSARSCSLTTSAQRREIWNQQKLATELETILRLDSSFEINATGFEIGEVDFHIEQLHRPAKEAPEPPLDPSRVEKVSRAGDLWILGRHRLFCGSSLEELSYRALLGNERARMVLTDPPYNLKIEGNASGLGKKKHSDFLQAAGEMSDDQFRRFLHDALRNLAEFSVDGSIHFIFMDWRQIALLVGVGQELYSELKSICVWNKGRGAMGSPVPQPA